MRVVFMGTAEFASKTIQALVSAGHDVMYAVSQPDKSKNRGKKILETPVKQKAVELGIAVLQPENIKGNVEFFDILKECNPDMIVVAAYGRILTEDILNLPKYGCVNVHASLLPRHRGAAPIQWAIYSGDKVTGVTIMQMAKGMDTGDMLSKVETEIGNKTSEELFEELGEAGAKLLIKTMEDIEKGKVIPEKQDEALATMAPMISKDDGRIDWGKSSCQIERMIRAFYPWPGTYTFMGDKQMKILEAKVDTPKGDEVETSAEHKDAVPGRIVSADKEGMKVETGDGILSVDMIQMPGKKKMKVQDYLRGNKIEIFTVLG